MKKRLIAMALGLVIATSAQTMTVNADSASVVTVGADLTDTQREKIFEYFGVEESSVQVLEITNTDERTYLEGVASESQIGHRTYSCAYIEPTEEGNGINVKTANLNWVTSYMIKSTLATAGIYDCNVLAAAPFEVSGTGALTGIMMAFETVTGTELDEEKKELATEELVMTGDLADEIGSDEATGIVTDIKNTVIGENVVVADDIEQVVIDASTKYDVTLTDDQVETIVSMMTKLAAQDYDYDRLESTFDSITDTAAEKLGIEIDSDDEDNGIIEAIKDFFVNIFNWIKNLFTGDDATSEDTNTDLGILNNANDTALGDDVITDSTEAEVTTTTEPTVEPTTEATVEPTAEATAEPTEEASSLETQTEEPSELTEDATEEETQDGEATTEEESLDQTSEQETNE